MEKKTHSTFVLAPSEGMMSVVYMETRAHSVRFTGSIKYINCQSIRFPSPLEPMQKMFARNYKILERELWRFTKICWYKLWLCGTLKWTYHFNDFIVLACSTYMEDVHKE